MNLPLHRARWPSKWIELWAERAAIIEYQGNLSREVAEIRAEQDIRKVAGREQAEKEHI